jgi:hypothetical protein
MRVEAARVQFEFSGRERPAASSQLNLFQLRRGLSCDREIRTLPGRVWAGLWEPFRGNEPKGLRSLITAAQCTNRQRTYGPDRWLDRNALEF